MPPVNFVQTSRMSFGLLIALVLLTACNRATTLTETEPTAPAAISGPGVLAACDADAQAAAMHPDHVPDWEALGLAACYELTFSLQPERTAYTGAARVTVTNPTGSALPELVFRIYPNAEFIFGGELTITAAQVDGAQVTPEIFLADGTAVRLRLSTPLQPDETAVIELEFTGRVPRDFGDWPRIYGNFNYATAERVLTLANAYPILAVWRDGGWQAEPVLPIGDAVVSEAALYRVSVTAPEGWQLITTGAAVETPSNGGETQQTFVSGPAREFILIASPTLVASESQVDGVRVRHWGLPAGDARWEEALQATVDSMRAYDARFGPYPYAELDVVAAPLDNAAGIEYPGLFLVANTLYEPDSQRPFLLGLVVAHEAAHQWWYGVVGSDVLAHPWQDEALTTFSSLVYQEEHQPEYYEGTIDYYEQGAAQAEREADDNAVAQPVEAFVADQGLYGPVVYLKGSLFFAELREELGDEVFFRALQNYYSSYQYKLAQPEDLLAAFEASCGCELDEFYAEWGMVGEQ